MTKERGVHAINLRKPRLGIAPAKFESVPTGRKVTHSELPIQTKPSTPIVVLIPAWNPERQLVAFVASLQKAGLSVLVIDDGSSNVNQPIFDELASQGTCVLRHAVNLGKGRALKTGFNCLLAEYLDAVGVVTADADGQHTVEDVIHVAEALISGGGAPVLGARDFGGEVPLRNRFGNLLTRYIFGFVTGTKLIDTQTGLRGFPLSLLSQLVTLDGERYEYEMAVLIYLCCGGRRPIEVPIETIYIEGNRSSRFNPVRDSMRIYFVLARSYFSSLCG